MTDIALLALLVPLPAGLLVWFTPDRHAGRVATVAFAVGIAGGLALIAAVVAEFAAGTAGENSGLAFRLIEAQHRLNIPRLFAALVLLSLTGVLIFAATSLLSHLLLRNWHESAVRREN